MASIPPGQLTRTVYALLAEQRWPAAVEVLRGVQAVRMPERFVAAGVLPWAAGGRRSGASPAHQPVLEWRAAGGPLQPSSTVTAGILLLPAGGVRGGRPDVRGRGRAAGRWAGAAGASERAVLLLPCRYEALATHHPDVLEYRLHWCQALYKAGLFAEASRGAAGVEGHARAVRLLGCAIRYEQDDLPGCRAALGGFSPSDPTATINLGCVLYKEGQFSAALDQFGEATQVGGGRRCAGWLPALEKGCGGHAATDRRGAEGRPVGWWPAVQEGRCRLPLSHPAAALGCKAAPGNSADLARTLAWASS